MTERRGYNLPHHFALVRERDLLKAPECQFDPGKPKQLLLLPGFGSLVSQLFPLVRTIRGELRDYGVTAIGLGANYGDFTKTLERVGQQVNAALDLSKAQQLVLFGYSHGGRFATALTNQLAENFPKLTLGLITAATPIKQRPRMLRGLGALLMSEAVRQWPAVEQPVKPNVVLNLAYYSENDRVVGRADIAKGFVGQRLRLEGVDNHQSYLEPELMGPVLVKTVLSML